MTGRTPSAAGLDEPQAGSLTVRYQPCDEVVTENPPRFAWLPALDETARYTLQVSKTPAFAAADTRTYDGIARNFFTPDHAVAPGDHVWRFAVERPGTPAQPPAWS